ncbi:MAG TPA: nickel pincer cofactor biosynthesis protein LarB [Bacteroidales bacterium]|nr:nickel pincer cofactor biosynthesis protein LarB [Bacteroidales bacterium]
MNPEELRQLFTSVRNGEIGIDDAVKKLKDFSFTDLGHTKIDNHRELRTGYPEVIFCSGKTVEQVTDIIRQMLTRNNNVLATRATDEMYKAVKKICAEAEFHSLARTIVIRRTKEKLTETTIAIVTAGTSDMPVAEEAAVTAELFGNRVLRVFDVGVAGIHRLYDKLPEIRSAKVIVVVAGMEGALPSIVGGLVDKPVIAVPTSIGYGANFHGLSALLGMLTSCASGVSVVNIDNGFGAGYMASMINKL